MKQVFVASRIGGAFLALSAFASASAVASYLQTNLVSDVSGLAAYTDANLVNPWGISSGAAGPWFVSSNGSGLGAVYNGNTGQPFPQPTPLLITISPAPGSSPGTPGSPTGQVYNGTADFEVSAGAPARVLFATRDGTLLGWSPSANPTTAIRMVDNSALGAQYTGLALGSNAGANLLYVADFKNARIDVFNANFAAVSLSGAFTDPNLPAGYAPFNVQNIGGKIYVTYALTSSPGQVAVGSGFGIVDVFDTAGNFLGRLASAGSQLNAPWGLALAPTDFGDFSGDLLIGNFGDGLINAFDPLNGLWKGYLTDGVGDPIAISGLLGIGFGNDGNAGLADALFFAAGIDGGTHGLFGSLTSLSDSGNEVPEPGTLLLLGLGLLELEFARRRQAS